MLRSAVQTSSKRIFDNLGRFQLNCFRQLLVGFQRFDNFAEKRLQFFGKRQTRLLHCEHQVACQRYPIYSILNFQIPDALHIGLIGA